CLVDRVDLDLCLLRRQPVKEKIDVRGRECTVVEILPEGPLRGFGTVGYWRKACLHRPASGYDVAPVGQLRERAFGEDRPVLLELVETSDHRRRAVLAPAVLGQRHDIFRAE